MRLPSFSRPGVAYILRDALYLSLTDFSPCTTLVKTRGPGFQMPSSSGFCAFGDKDKEPSVEELVAIIDDCYEAATIVGMGEEDQGVTFAGLGDPLEKIDILLETVHESKQKRHGIPFSVTTSGLYDVSIAGQLKNGGVKAITVALNAADPKTYSNLMIPTNGKSFGDVCNFVVAAAEIGMNVTCTAVEAPGVDTTSVRKLAESLGASEFKLRSFFS
jgi:TatD family-associated radical SAM protein